MAHWKSMTDREYLYAFDLQGRDVDVQIARVVGADIVGQAGKKSKKPKIYFAGKEKPLIANATNCKTITAIVGDPDTDKWVGQWITLYSTTCQAMSGETVDCIRIRPKAPSRRAAPQAESPATDPAGAE